MGGACRIRISKRGVRNRVNHRFPVLEEFSGHAVLPQSACPACVRLSQFRYNA